MKKAGWIKYLIFIINKALPIMIKKACEEEEFEYDNDPLEWLQFIFICALFKRMYCAPAVSLGSLSVRD